MRAFFAFVDIFIDCALSAVRSHVACRGRRALARTLQFVLITVFTALAPEIKHGKQHRRKDYKRYNGDPYGKSPAVHSLSRALTEETDHGYHDGTRDYTRNGKKSKADPARTRKKTNYVVGKKRQQQRNKL